MALHTEHILDCFKGSNTSFFTTIFKHHTYCNKKLEDKKQELEAIYSRYPQLENVLQEPHQEEYILALATYRQEILTCFKEIDYLEDNLRNIRETLSEFTPRTGKFYHVAILDEVYLFGYLGSDIDNLQFFLKKQSSEKDSVYSSIPGHLPTYLPTYLPTIA